MTSLFVDESKVKGYTMVAVEVAPHRINDVRTQTRSLALRGQRRIHFTSESDSRRRLILARLCDLDVAAQVFYSPAKDESAGRRDCLEAIVAYSAERGVRRLVLERDESVEPTDRQTLYREVRSHGLNGSLEYSHEAPHLEPVLWIADAIAG